MFEKTKTNEKDAGVGPFLKKEFEELSSAEIQTHESLHYTRLLQFKHYHTHFLY